VKIFIDIQYYPYRGGNIERGEISGADAPHAQRWGAAVRREQTQVLTGRPKCAELSQ
jgi:hypothetical protein